jgi:hypothetical protein
LVINIISAHPLVGIIKRARIRIKAAAASGILGEKLILKYFWSAFHNTSAN